MSRLQGFDKADWYWVVGGDNTQAWSSRAAAYVPVADAAYQAWLANDGHARHPTHIASEADLAEVLGDLWPTYVPPIVLTWKARAALKMADKFDAAAQAVAASNNVAVQEAFEYSAEWHRTSPAVNAMAQAIGMTSDEVDDLFRTADSITV